MTARDELFDLAHGRGDIEAAAGSAVKLFRDGRQLRGECPLCGASKGKKSGGAFSADPDKKIFYCFSCEEGGDVVELEHRVHGGTRREAAARLAGVDLAQWDAEQKKRAEAAGEAYAPAEGFARDRPAARPRRAVQSGPAGGEADSDAWKAALAARLWREAVPAARSPARAYFTGRGMDGPQLDAALGQLRWHPAAYHSGRPGGSSERKAPAIIGLVTARGVILNNEARPRAMATGGVHATYLSPDCRRKAALQPPRRMWGPQGLDRDGAIEPGCVWLTSPDADGDLIVAEGIESGISAAMLMGGGFRVAATLSLRALQGGWATDRWGRRSVDAPAADFDTPAFFWPPGDRADGSPAAVMIAVDRDMGEIKVKVRKAGGGTWKRPIRLDDRARICGGLAEQHWRRRLGDAHAVRVIAPGAGRDFNDELMARRAAGMVVA